MRPGDWSPHCWTKRFLNRSVRLELTAPSDSAELELLLRPLPDCERAEVSYRLTPLNQGFSLDRPAGAKAGSPAEAFHILESDLFDEWLESERGVFIVHASAVAHRKTGRVVLLAGPSHSGKSTLSFALAASGEFHYLSEEAVALDPSSGCLTAYPKPVKLRYGNENRVEMSEPWDLIPVEGLNFAYGIPPESCLGARGRTEAPSLLLFPSYQEGNPASMESMTRGEVVGLLATYVINPPDFMAGRLERLKELFCDTPARRLHWSDPPAVRDCLSRYLEKESGG